MPDIKDNNDKTILYVVLIFAVIVILFLIWYNNNQSKRYPLRFFEANIDSQSQNLAANGQTQDASTGTKTTNGYMTQSVDKYDNILRKIYMLKNSVGELKKYLDQVSVKTIYGQNVEANGQMQNIVNEINTINKYIKGLNNIFPQLNTENLTKMVILHRITSDLNGDVTDFNQAISRLSNIKLEKVDPSNVINKILAKYPDAVANINAKLNADDANLSAQTNTVTVPQQVMTAPQQVMTAPQQVMAAPQQVMAAPQQVMTAPQQVMTAPAQQMTPSQNVAYVPFMVPHTQHMAYVPVVSDNTQDVAYIPSSNVQPVPYVTSGNDAQQVDINCNDYGSGGYCLMNDGVDCYKLTLSPSLPTGYWLKNVESDKCTMAPNCWDVTGQCNTKYNEY